MAREARWSDASGGMDDQYEGSGVDLGAAPAPPSPAETPGEAAGSQAPPADAGDESPDRQFPVPPVPPPPAAGPIFSLAGGGGGGAASFARPGTEAAQPFRSPLFTANRSTALPGAAQARFGAGTAVTAGGGASAPFLPAGLGEEPGGAPPDELQRILALMRGGGAR